MKTTRKPSSCVGYLATLVSLGIKQLIKKLNSLDLPFTEMSIHFENYKLHMKNYIDRLWQGEWDGCSGHKLNKVEPVLGDKRLPGHLARQEEIVLSCLFIGHTYLTLS